jgi:hypothetical protein
MPGWVRWPGLVIGVLVVVFVVLRLLGVQHGPGMHGPMPNMPSNGPTHAPGGGHS